MTILLARADARSLPLRDGSVQCCVTSPPYWGLRDYGTPGQLGLEATPDEYVTHMVEVFREVRRVLRDDGTLWLNLGDAYCSGTAAPRKSTTTTGSDVPASWSNRCQKERIPCVDGLKPKDLVGIPWRVAFALQADGWYLRSDIVWHKPNPMPESVTDRPTRAHEYIFLLAKSERYYYDHEAIREEIKPSNKGSCSVVERHGGTAFDQSGKPVGARREYAVIKGANRRSVWTISTQPYKGAHYATFPMKLVEPCILAGTSAKGACPKCGSPWKRIVERPERPAPVDYEGKNLDTDKQSAHRRMLANVHAAREAGGDHDNPFPAPVTVGWRPTCTCDAGDPRPCVVLDPFCGTATVARVAIAHGRRAACFDISGEYLCEQAARRTRNVQVNLL